MAVLSENEVVPLVLAWAFVTSYSLHVQNTLPELAYCNGTWVSNGNRRFSVFNPASGALLGSVTDCGAEQTTEAIVGARLAFPAWRDCGAYERAALLNRLATILRSNLELLAATMTAEQGKPLAEARREIVYGASYVEWYAEEAKRVYGETIPHYNPRKTVLIEREPIGVVAAITPWNFPHAMVARKMAAALAAGCCCIVKPAPETPFSALRLAECCEEAGIPAGVFSVLPASDAKAVAEPLLASSTVRKLSFTGSTEVGKVLYRESAATLKRLTLELGGNAPCIICEDASLDEIVDDLIFGKFRNAGQTCVCINRFLVHSSIETTFTKLFSERAAKLVVGDGQNTATTVGPLISDRAVEKVRRLLDDALENGARLAHGDPAQIRGRFVPPIVLTRLTPQMAIWREEIFGPIACISTFSSDTEALELANDTEHGLASYVYTANINRAFALARGLAYGMVGVNDTMISLAQAPFGGVKQSGFGREGGHAGIEEYLSLKYIALGLQ